MKVYNTVGLCDEAAENRLVKMQAKSVLERWIKGERQGEFHKAQDHSRLARFAFEAVADICKRDKIGLTAVQMLHSAIAVVQIAERKELGRENR